MSQCTHNQMTWDVANARWVCANCGYVYTKDEHPQFIMPDHVRARLQAKVKEVYGKETAL